MFKQGFLIGLNLSLLGFCGGISSKALCFFVKVVLFYISEFEKDTHTHVPEYTYTCMFEYKCV